MYAPRPSAAHIWGTGGCHGYYAMIAQYPELPDTDNTVRDFGIGGHWLAHKKGEGFIIPEGSFTPNGVEVDEEMVEGVDLYLSELRTTGYPVYLEMTLPAPWIHERCGGTADAWSWDPVNRKLTVWDLKLGFRYVDAFENPQLVIYVSAILDYLHKLGVIVLDGHHEQNIDVEVVVVQPRSFGADTIRRWRTKAVLLRPLWNKLRAAAIETLGPNPTLRTGSHCADCPARYACPAAQRAGLDSMDVSAQSIPHQLTPEQAGNAYRRVLKALENLQSLATGLEQQLLHEMLNGHQDPHWRIGYGRTSTVYIEGGEQQLIGLAKAMNLDVCKETRAKTPKQVMEIMDPELVKRFITTRSGKRRLEPVTERSIRKALSQ